MILPGMTYEEMAAQYLGDLHDIMAKKKTFQAKFSSYVKRSRSKAYPMTAQYEYVSHTNRNRYLYCYTAFKRSDWDEPYCNAICLFEGKGGMYAMATSNFQKTVIIFTPHFFSRYRERILHGEDIHGDALIKRYFSNNTRFVLKEMDETFARAYKKYEDDESQSWAARVNEGNIFLKTYNDKVVLCKTIISDEMLYDNQAEAFGELRQKLDNFKNIKIQGYKDNTK